MKKKGLWLFFSITLLMAFLVYFIQRPLQSHPVSYTLVSEKQLEKIRANYEMTTENLLTDLRFNQVSLVQDVATATFYLPLNMEDPVWESGEITSGQPDVEILFERAFEQDDKQSAIREGTRYEFLAVQGNRYRSYFLVFTGLPIVSIETEETADTEIFGGMIRFWEADSKRDWASSNILEAHIRGNTSRLYPKKGYKLALRTQDKDGNVVPDKRSLFGLREDDEYILNAMYTDASKLRDKLCADIWGGMGAFVEEFPNMRLGTNMTYVELFFNGEYWGLYALLEPVDSRQLDLNREKDKGITEYAYKSSHPQDIPTEEMEQMTEWPKEMAGYSLRGTYSEIGREQWQPLLDYLNWVEGPKEESFISQTENMVNTDNLMRMWVYLQAVMGIDNRAKNMFYVAKATEDGYRIYLAPWDMDLTLGDTLQASRDPEYPWSVGQNIQIYRERININPADRLLKSDAERYAEQISAIWTEVREGVLSDAALTSAIDRLSYQVEYSGALKRDRFRWPRSKYGEDYDKLKSLLCYRMKLLDSYFYDNLNAYMSLGYQ